MLDEKHQPDAPDESPEDIAHLQRMLWALRPKGKPELLRALGNRLLAGEELGDYFRLYLGQALIDLAEGKSKREAFNMLGPGRPKDKDATIRNLKIALDIATSMRAGRSFEEAAYYVAQDYNVSDHTAEKAYKQHARALKKAKDLEPIRTTVARMEAAPEALKHWAMELG